jgi:glutathione S-transferase
VTLTIYGDLNSGNCLKVKWTAEKLGLRYDWVAVDVVAGGAKAPAFRQINPAAQVPTVVLADGRSLAQSNAIILHLAEGSELIPADPYQRAKMLEWLFWEQNSHEPNIAVRRRLKHLVGKPDSEIDPSLLEGGERALARMESWLGASPFLVDGKLSLADIALSAYTRLSPQGGFDLGRFPAVKAWIGRVEAELGLEPLPA